MTKLGLLKDLGLGAGVLYGVLKSNELHKRINEIQKKLGNTIPVADVMVKRVGEEAYAIRTDTREVIAHSNDLGLVLNEAINKLYIDDIDFYIGKIYISRGYYISRTRINIPAKSRITIVGDGVHSTILKFTGFNATEFSKENSCFLYDSDVRVYDKPFHLEGHIIADYSQHLEIANLAIDTQDEKYLTALYVRNIDRLYIRNVRLKGYFSESEETPGGVVTGCGIYIETMANNEVHLDNVKVSGYYVAFRLRADHVVVINGKVGRCYIGYEYSTGTHFTIVHPETYQVKGYHHYFATSNGKKLTILNPSIEGMSTSVAFQYNAWGDEPLIINPYIAGIQSISNDLSKIRIKGNGFEASGVAVFSGDGSTTQFKIEHGLIAKPSKIIVTPLSADAKNFAYVESDDTYIYFNFSTAPPSGTDNVKLSWYAEV